MVTTHNAPPRARGNHPPSGTLVSAAPQNSPSRKPKKRRKARPNTYGLERTNGIDRLIRLVVMMRTVETANWNVSQPVHLGEIVMLTPYARVKAEDEPKPPTTAIVTIISDQLIGPM
jgi:hypothetical protein